MSEENTFTIKMTDTSEKEKRMHKKVEHMQRDNEKMMQMLKRQDALLTAKNHQVETMT